MRKKRFTDEKVIRLLREQEASGENVQDFCRRHSVTTSTFYRWKRGIGTITGLSEAACARVPGLRNMYDSAFGLNA